MWRVTQPTRVLYFSVTLVLLNHTNNVQSPPQELQHQCSSSGEAWGGNDHITSLWLCSAPEKMSALWGPFWVLVGHHSIWAHPGGCMDTLTLLGTVAQSKIKRKNEKKMWRIWAVFQIKCLAQHGAGHSLFKMDLNPCGSLQHRIFYDSKNNSIYSCCPIE